MEVPAPETVLKLQQATKHGMFARDLMLDANPRSYNPSNEVLRISTGSCSVHPGCG